MSWHGGGGYVSVLPATARPDDPPWAAASAAGPTWVSQVCAGCHTNYGRMVVWGSAKVELYCTRTNCRRRTVLYLGGLSGA